MKPILRIIAAAAVLMSLTGCSLLQKPSESSETTTFLTNPSMVFSLPSTAYALTDASATQNASTLSGAAPTSPSAAQTTRSQIKPPVTEPPVITTKGSEAQATVSVVRVVIPEGFSFYQVAQRLEANGVCTAAAFYAAAQAYQVQSFSIPDTSAACYRMEGLLFPATYEFYKGDNPDVVLRKMLNHYAASSGLPRYDLLILASIIERETRSDSHMAMVSSVFHNRLKAGMRLQADSTIAYVEQHIKANPLVNNPAQYAERYNTYKCAALPAGPICNPGIRAINAALNPAQSDYLYFFFGNDNTNHYAKTYEEHKALMKQFGVNNG